jgi:nucleoside phosphorylase
LTAYPYHASDTVPPVILVVAATERELDSVTGADRLVCGIGPVEAALATANALAARRPSAVLHVGIAGARSLPPPSLVLGSEAIYADVLDPGSKFPRVTTAAPDRALLEAALAELPEAYVLPIATTGRVGGGAVAEVEAMEGFAVLRAAALAGVPALEVRAISNPVGEPDRARWQIDEALSALAASVPKLIAALDG